MSLQILDTESELSVSCSAKRFVLGSFQKPGFVRRNDAFKLGELAIFAKLKIDLCKEIIITKMY